MRGGGIHGEGIYTSDFLSLYVLLAYVFVPSCFNQVISLVIHYCGRFLRRKTFGNYETALTGVSVCVIAAFPLPSSAGVGKESFALHFSQLFKWRVNKITNRDR